MINNSQYLEDTIFCNDRTIEKMGGLNPNGGTIRQAVIFTEYITSKDLLCKNETDKFSVNNEIAKLKYPIGLITWEEKQMMGKKFRYVLIIIVEN